VLYNRKYFNERDFKTGSPFQVRKEAEYMTADLDQEIIVAPGTPLGFAAISIIRLSGSGVVDLIEKVFKPRNKNLRLSQAPDRVMHLGHIYTERGEKIDEVLVVVMRGPQSYTRQDVVEIHSHGGIMAAQQILEQVIKKGARLAEPGEFTKRAWLNGRIDLTQAESVIDLIRARSRKSTDQAIAQLDGNLSTLVSELRQQLKRLMAGVEAGIDFPDEITEQEEYALKNNLIILLNNVDKLLETGKSGRVYREGLAVVLLGKPNTGKSTLLNKILGSERALVTDIPGTTRDLLEEMVNIKGIPVRLIDTAGIREKAGVVETLGIERTKEALEQADLILAVFDASTTIEQADRMVADLLSNHSSIILLNKIDVDMALLKKEQLVTLVNGMPILEISARLGWGLEDLEHEITSLVGAGPAEESAAITRVRHQVALRKVRDAISSALETICNEGTLDCAAVDLWDAWSALGEIVGESVPEEIIDAIFKEFCIGK
jgi:tRNA modification GTPase